MLKTSRYLALAFSLALAVTEFLLNQSRDAWQYAPLWIIDYVIVLSLLGGFFITRNGRHVGLLMSSWALTAGVFYMAYFMSKDPSAIRPGPEVDERLMCLVGLGLLVSLIGVFCSKMVLLKREGNWFG